MKQVLFLIMITVSYGLFGGGDHVLTHSDEIDTLSREDLSRLACAEKRYVAQHTRGKGQRSEEKDQDGAFQGTALQMLANQATRALAEVQQEVVNCKALGSRKHSGLTDEKAPVKRPREHLTRVFFTERSGRPIEDHLIDLIKKEKKSIRGAMYIFSNKRLAQALADQIEHEGIQVSIVVDSSFKEHRSESCLRFLIENGVSVYVSPAENEVKKKIMHHKIARFYNNAGNELVTFGSYNWSGQANNNDENLVESEEPTVIEAFDEELDRVMASSLLLELSDQGLRPELELNPAT